MQYKKVVTILGAGILSATILSGCTINNPTEVMETVYGPPAEEYDWETQTVEVNVDDLASDSKNDIDLEVCLYGPAPYTQNIEKIDLIKNDEEVNSLNVDNIDESIIKNEITFEQKNVEEQNIDSVPVESTDKI